MRNATTKLLALLACVCLSADVSAKSGGGFASSGGFSGGGSKGFSAPVSAPKVSIGGGGGASIGKGFSMPESKPAPRIDFDTAASRARAHEESGSLFRQSQEQPRTTQRTETPREAPRETPRSNPWAVPDDPPRQSRPPIFGSAPPPPPPQPRVIVVERPVRQASDDTYFWLWLMERSSQRQRDDWVYNHRNEISPSQMDDLRRRDSGIDDRLRERETSGAKQDSGYKIPESDIAKDVKVEQPSSFHWFWFLFCLLLVGGAIAFVIFHNSHAGIAPETPKAPKKPEMPKDVFNPIGLALGGYVRVQTPTLITKTLRVRGLYELTRRIGGKSLKIADYSLHDDSVADDAEGGTWATVRVIDQGRGKYDCVVLRPQAEMKFSKEALAALNGDEIVDDETKLTYRKLAAYRNVGVREITDEGETLSQMDYFDFINTDGGKNKLYVVEMDRGDGWIQTYKGESIVVDDVKLLSGHTSIAA